MNEKRCPKCGEIKGFNEFCGNKRSTDGKNCWCKQCSAQLLIKWRKMNQGKIAKYRKHWKTENPIKVKVSNKKWRDAHPERNSAHTVKEKLDISISTGIYRALRDSKAGRRWEDLVEFNLEQLKKHIEKRFTKGMSWERYMNGEIHIDHKIPKAAFNFERPEDIDFKRCWCLKNLQPLWAKDNLTKYAKIDKPFQPALTLNEWRGE